MRLRNRVAAIGIGLCIAIQLLCCPAGQTTLSFIGSAAAQTPPVPNPEALVITVAKPQNGEMVTRDLSTTQPVRLDLSAVANEKFTLARLDVALFVVFDNGGIVVLKPFFKPDGTPLANITVELSGRTLSAVEFAAAFPIDDKGNIAIGSSGAPDKDPRVVELLYATNRQATPGAKRVSYSGERSTDLSFGAARVRVPEDHKTGHIELPSGLFGISFSKRVDETKHFVIKEVTQLDQAKFLDVVRAADQHTALVFVHGFNTTFDEGIFRLAQIVWDLQFKGVPILFSWPSAGGVTNYARDQNSALGARGPFVRLLNLLKADGNITTLHVIAHSMGNMVVMEALNRSDAQMHLSQVVLAAPDVDESVFADLAIRVREISDGVTLYASSKDKALVASRKLARKPRAGDVPSTGPILVPRLDTIDVTSLGDEMFGLNHNTFAANRSLIDDIARIFKNERPPDRRTPELRGVPEKADPPRYWRYAK